MMLPGLLFGAALLWILQCSLYKHYWKRGLEASVSFCEDHVFEGDTASLDEIITNAKLLPLPALHVKFQMGRELVFCNQENSSITDQNYRSDIFSCLPWQQIHRHLTFTCQHRGYYTISQIDLVSYDFLWSSQFYTTCPADTFLYVYPAFADIHRLELPLSQLMGALNIRNALLRDPFDLYSIRDYRPEDPYRNINWKATARTGSLKINVHTPAASRQVTLLLDADSDKLRSDADLKEENVRLAAALASELLTRQIPVSIRSNALDCITHTELELAPGSGQNHLQAILMLLARADLADHPNKLLSQHQQRRTMEQLIAELVDTNAQTSSQNTPIYVLLSPCQRSSLAKQYAALCQTAPGSQWILPIRPGDDLRLNSLPFEIKDQFYPWETRR